MCLGLDFLIALALSIAPLGMPDDCETGARVEEHQRRRTAGMRAFFRVMDVLPANGEARDCPRRAFDEGRRYAQSDIHAWNITRGSGNRPNLIEVG